MGTDDVDVVRSSYEAMARGDVPGVFAPMADDVEWHESEGLPYGGRFRGPAEIGERVFGPLFADFPDFSVTPEQFIGQDGTVAVVVRYRGTASRTQARLDQPAVHVWDVRDGRIVRFRQFVDTVKYLEVAGPPA